MTHPLLVAINKELKKTAPADIQAQAENGVLSEVQDELGISGSRVTTYKDVNISRSLAQLGQDGWMVRPKPKAD